MSAMQISTTDITFSAMKKSGDKEPTNMRLSGELLDRARDFIAKQPVKPSMTAVIEAALLEWLDKHNPREADDAKRPKPRK